jgi:hypothetical protein
MINGRITDSSGRPIPDANILVLHKGSISVAYFTASAKDGSYLLDFPNDTKTDSMIIKVTIVGYRIESKIVATKDHVTNFILMPLIVELPAVAVKQELISVAGDTINYKVSTFAGAQDRFIGDVMAKIPGITIDASGAIAFNGRLINAYYINGINLLEGRYSIANRNIPFDLVERVQVLQNHQPVHVLDSLSKTFDPAINIQLKKNAIGRLMGNSKLAGGFSPALGEIEITGLQFAEKMQLISFYKYNNTGTRLQNETTVFASIHRAGDAENSENKDPDKILSLVSMPNPSLPTNLYLFNNNHLFNLSLLSVLKNSAQIKTNINYNNDFITSDGQNHSVYFLPAKDSLVINEIQHAGINSNKFSGSLVYELNEKKKFIKNTFTGDAQIEKQRGSIINITPINQQLNQPFYSVKNDFQSLFPLRNKLIIFKSLSCWNHQSQSLEIMPGSFPELFNDSLPYISATQQVVINTFTTDNTAGFSIGHGSWKQQFIAGAKYTSNQLGSQIYKTINSQTSKLGDPFTNDLLWNNLRIYASTLTNIQKGDKKLEIEWPLEFNTLSVKNEIRNSINKTKRLFFNPHISFYLPFDQIQSVIISYSKQHILGNVTQIANNPILDTYRILSQNDSLLPLQGIDTYLFSFSSKNPLKTYFYNASVSYTRFSNNLMTEQVYNGYLIRNTSVERPNDKYSLQVNGSINKYFLSNRMNLVVNISYGNSKSLILQGGQIMRVESIDKTASVRFSFNKWSFLSFEGASALSYYNTILGVGNENNTSFDYLQLRQDLKLNFLMPKNFTMYFNSLWYTFSEAKTQHGYYFGDIGLRKKFKTIELQMTVMNIANVNSYNTLSIFSNSKFSTQTRIRPRALMVQGYFNF